METTVLRKADFNPKVCTYWLLTGILTCIFTVIGIPFLLIWIPLGSELTKRYLKSIECVLTPKSLHVKKGVFNRVEKTIPLEKITDMGLKQDVIMRAFGLEQLTVETAGQSGAGALVSLTGVVEARAFREAVLEQRDAVASKEPVSAASAPVASADETVVLLREIRDCLQRIESNFRDRS